MVTSLAAPRGVSDAGLNRPEANSSLTSELAVTDGSSPALHRTGRSTVLILSLSVLTLALGFAVQVMLAATLGTGRSMDILLIALTVPTGVASLALTVPVLVLLPLIRQVTAAEGPAAAAMIAGEVVAKGAVVAFAVLTTLAGGAPMLVRLMAPGFSPEESAASAQLLRIMAVGSGCDVLRGVLSGLSMARKRFLQPHLAPALNHALMLITVVLLFERFGLVAVALAWTAGSVAMLVLLVPGQQLRLPRGRRPSAIVGPFLIPCFVYALLTQAVPWVDRLVASTLSPGAIAYVGYGAKLLEILLRTAPAALIMAHLPDLAMHAAQQSWVDFRATLVRVLRLVTLAAVPLGLTVALLANPLVVVLFQRGAFDVVSSAGVARAVAWYGLALLPAALVYALSNAYIALSAHAALARRAAAGLVAVAALDLVLSRWFGFVGIAIASGVVALLLLVTLVVGLRRWRLHDLLAGQGGFLLRVAGSALPLVVMLQLGGTLLIREGAGWSRTAGATVATSGLAGLCYVGSLRLLRIHEVERLLARLRRR